MNQSEKLFNIINSDLINHGGTSFYRKVIVHFFNFNYRLIYSYRVMKWFDKSFLSKINVFLHLKQSFIFNSYISPKALLGQKVKFAHAHGVIIGQAKIGDGVIIFQQVTIGSHGNSLAEKAWPTIGNNCKIYAGAKILGNVKIGNNCTIGANCVVMKDLSDNSIVMAPQAKIIGYNDEGKSQ